MNYVTYEQMVIDTRILAQKIKNKYAGVISIPRSGNIPSNIIGLHFNIPVHTINEFVNNIEVTKFTQRLGKANTTSTTYLVVDDSINSGERMKQTKHALAGTGFTFEYVCIYATESTTQYINHYARILPQPRVFEWNVFNHAILANSCLDIDGVVCPDPNPHVIDEVRDERSYINHISNSDPIRIIKVPIKCFVTSRLEKYRTVTENWLKKHGFQYNELHMSQYQTATERRRLNRHADDKADVYRMLNGTLMIESSDVQAKRIFDLTGKPVLCTDSNKMYMR